MVVQAGEGTEDIIYGTTSIPAGARTFGGYLARPDGPYEWPTVLVYDPSGSPSSTIKNICRVFARHGIAALSPVLDGDPGVDRRVGRGIASFIGAPNGDWSNGEYGFGIVAFESGVRAAADLAAIERVVAFAAVGATFDDDVVDALAEADAPTLFIGSRADEAVDIDASLGARDRLRRATYAIYPDGDTGFWSDASDGFRTDRYEDTMDRLIAFFGSHLPARL